ncbi:MAG TPA: SDR family NAD(P)-dependent oxidoreductase [Solirubrobacterales bacterium]|nr:SDR family NAD(P)-dependent oxidoreductase [Solirubrobacterales bacterium]
MRGFDGKVAIVSGGSSGIGLATSKALRDRGATVVVADLQEPLDPGLEATFVETDVREPAAWAALVERVEAELGGIDLVHLNAGVGLFEEDITKVSDERYRWGMGINIDGVFFGARAVLPSIEARGGGAIVATASLAGLIAFAPDPVYAAAKHAVVGLVRALAPPLRAKGITVDAVCPAVTDTPIVPAEVRSEVERVGLPMVPPEDIAAAVIGAMADDEETGQVFVCQHGREAIPYAFRGVPGPAGGQRPPKVMGDPSETVE